MIIVHLHQYQDRDQGAHPGHATTAVRVCPPAGHGAGELTPPLTKIVLHLQNVQELGRLKTGILQSSVNPSIHETPEI